MANRNIMVEKNNLEKWGNIEGFETKYQISTTGQIKSLARLDSHGRRVAEKILKQNLISGNYYGVTLCKNGLRKTYKVHQLMAVAFLGHERCGYKAVVNHKDFDMLNNILSNLEIISARENTNKKHLSSSSKYTGVSRRKRNGRWLACICIKGENKHLGSFVNEEDAHRTYEIALKELQNV